MKLYSTIKYIIWIFILLSPSLSAQRLLKISVSLGDKSEHLSYVSRRGLSFVSAKELAVLLGGSYYFNDQAHKVEMKFKDYKIAIEKFEKAIEMTPNGSFIHETHVKTGKCLKELGNYDIALKNLEKGKNLALERNDEKCIKKADKYISEIKTIKEK